MSEETKSADYWDGYRAALALIGNDEDPVMNMPLEEAMKLPGAFSVDIPPEHAGSMDDAIAYVKKQKRKTA